MQLRPYQNTAIDETRVEFRRGCKGVILAAPTGSGKTVMACEVMRNAVAKGSRVLFLAHRDELISQCSNKLSNIGLPHGIIKAGLPPLDALAPIQVASIQTLVRRNQIPPARLMIVDECHHIAGGSYRTMIERYPNTLRLGLSATPYRLDGQGLGEFFDSIVRASTFTQLLIDGFLVLPRVFAPPPPSMKGVHVRQGDYVAKESAAVFNKPQLVADVVKTWRSRADGRCTVVFACNVEHSQSLVAQFVAAGVAAEHVDAKTEPTERKARLARLASGETTVLSNCMILTEGWDLPRCSCVIMARPTQSKCLYRQMIGRGLRTDEEKNDCIILDHAGNVFRHGAPTDEDEFDLAGSKAKNKDTSPPIRNCPKCFSVQLSSIPVCKECGHVFVSLPREEIEVVAGELSEMEWDAPLKNLAENVDVQWRFYQRQLKTAAEKGYKAGWARFRFKSMFGKNPDPSWTLAEEIGV